MYTFRAEVDRVFGENYYLKPRCQGGRAYLYMPPKAKRYKEELLRQLSLQVSSSSFPYGQVFPKRLVYHFYISRDRDVSNMIKVTEDAVAEAIGVDDSVWEEVVARKYVQSSLEREVVIIEVHCW